MSRKKNLKSSVKLRWKTNRKGTIDSAYLDIYLGDGHRKYEFLKLYKQLNSKNPIVKAQNKHAEEAAEAIRAKRQLELIDSTAGLKKQEDKDLLLCDLMDIYANEKLKTGRSNKNSTAIRNTARHLCNMMGEKSYKEMKLADIDTDYCEDFISYLHKAPKYLGREYKKKDGTFTKPKSDIISQNTMSLYYTQFACALKFAERKGMIVKSPCTGVDKTYKKLIKPEDSDKSFLDEEEIKLLINTPCKEQVKRAFLFGCFCGLRISDIEALTWGNIQNGMIKIRMKKTGEFLPLPLGKNAKKWLPKRNGKTDSDKVFDLPSQTTIAKTINKWASEAGIKKHLSPHSARHTFATALISEGADLYTVSKLLGHHSLKTTQIYAEVVAAKKRHAVSLLDNI